jgi:hypothetical protein
MGCFSWLFADTNNTHNLRMGKSGYIACPNGTFIHEPCYDGYGEFDGRDVYELVVQWNREFIAENPDHLLPHVFYYSSGEKKQYRLKDFCWYPVVADLSIPTEKLAEAIDKYLRETLDNYSSYMAELRCVGIDIACYAEDNASLPYPIKITRTTRGIRYADLPASRSDPEQGMCKYHAPC